MGIQGLLPFLKKASRPASIKEFKGCTVAIDSYCWLHRGAFSCAEKLAMGEATDQYVNYCMKYVNSLLSFGIKPIMVLDGCSLPSKKAVETARREKREVHRKKAAQFLREGKRAEARDCLTKCIDITPQMALCLMEACRAKGVDCIVAPYEADAQLAFFSQAGVAQVVITEDSDLVLFGCEKIMFKMDFNGNGLLIDKKELNNAMGLNANSFTFEKFRYMCILSGCDYMPSLPGIGLGKANKVFKITRQTDMDVVLKKLPATLNMSSLTVTAEYIEGFFRANNTFLYQLVYDPFKRQLVPLNPYPPEVDPTGMTYAGPPISPERAFQIALGNIDIYTGKKIADFDPDSRNHQTKHKKLQKSVHGSDAKSSAASIWDRNYTPPIQKTIKSDGSEEKSRHGPPTEVTVTLPIKVASRPKLAIKRKHDEPDVNEDQVLSMYESEPAIKRSRTENPAVMDTERAFNTLDNSPVKSIMSNEQENLEELKEDATKSQKCKVNKFAVGKQNSGRRFSLDSHKSPEAEVKSRFFRTKEPLGQSKFYQELDRGHQKEPDDDQSLDENESSDDERPNDGIDEHVNVKTDNQSNPESEQASNSKSSSKSSSLDKYKSCFDHKPKNRISLDKTSVDNMFKPVRPRTDQQRVSNCDKLGSEYFEQKENFGSQSSDIIQLSNQSTSSLFNVEINGLVPDENETESETILPTSPPQPSRILSETSPNSVKLNSSPDSETSKFFNGTKKSNDFYASAYKSNNSKSNPDFKSDLNSTGSDTFCNRPKLQSGCRSIGLSKSSSSSQKSRASLSKKTETETGKAQPSIKNFFDKFKFKNK